MPVHPNIGICSKYRGRLSSALPYSRCLATMLRGFSNHWSFTVLATGPPESLFVWSYVSIAEYEVGVLNTSGDKSKKPSDLSVDISIVIPCLNEVATVAVCVDAARDALRKGGWSGEVIVSDNGSTDGSILAAQEAGAKVVRQPIRGYGAAVLRGFEVAQGEILVVMDGDNTYDLTELSRFTEPLRVGYDMVLGTRRNGVIHRGAMRKRHRHFIEPIQAWLCQRCLSLRVSDVRCGLRSIRREALDRLSLGSTGMEFASEMVIEAARIGLSTVEVPVSFHPRTSEQPRRSMGDGWRVARQILLISPSQLFMIPGVLLMLVGAGLELALLGGPVRLGSRLTLDFHMMFVGGGMAMLGSQLLLLGIYAKTWSLVTQEGIADAWIRWLHLHYTLERGLVAGGCLFVVGLLVNAHILFTWMSSGMGGDLFAVRPAILALTLMVLGAEVVFASFFLSVLRGTRFGRV
jgi:glycosyltransferase involved in cell wall biosynthesis